jgi:hypothetical protein
MLIMIPVVNQQKTNHCQAGLKACMPGPLLEEFYNYVFRNGSTNQDGSTIQNSE